MTPLPLRPGAAAGPTASGPTAAGPAASGPAAAGTAAAGRAASGHAAVGHTAANPTASGPTASGPAAAGTDPLDAALQAGRAAFARGDTVAAVAAFTRAADIARDEGRPASVAEALLRRGEAYQTDGRWDDAAGDFAAALRQATTARNTLLIAAAAGSLGGVMLLRRRTAIAEPLLRRAETTARQAGDPGIMAAVANDLGNLLAVTNRNEDARRQYDRAIRLADRPYARRSPGSPADPASRRSGATPGRSSFRSPPRARS